MKREQFNDQTSKLISHLLLNEKFHNVELRENEITLISQVDVEPEVLLHSNDEVKTFEVQLVISFNDSYQAPVLYFRVYETTMHPDKEEEEETISDSQVEDYDSYSYESRKLIFNQDVLKKLIFRNDRSYGSASKMVAAPSISGSDESSTDTLLNLLDIDTELSNLSDTPTSTSIIFTSESARLELSNLITITDPSLSSVGPYYMIHPCQTIEFLKQLELGANTDELVPLIVWWGFYSRIIL
ncbi:hypothetical protein CANARDRAFT_4956 [[Candida] arabinofermentans NRRL YB-2248]|uniref:Uncharacterized protein n=1 Tax=[Candida] arabinofermentans NRRL YB-2248 TaxID=983967 RepID=A0A1E4T7E3_9ASCO|nr:hypothetical protein CANARDRAFT_4956 [[Candida] arabinofermentans NRRL YB-2248]